MAKRIIVNADDFGLCKGVNEAVVKAHEVGVLTSATLMTNMPAAEEAVEMAKLKPSLGVGVHLNLSEGRAVSGETNVNCLLDSDGQFAYSPLRLSVMCIALHTVRRAIETELAAQIRWVIDRGLVPTHLDSHKHIHSFPVIFPIVCRLASRFKIPAIRWPFEPKVVCQRPWPLLTEDGRKRAAIVRTMAKINRIQNRDFLKTEGLFGVAHTGRVDVNFFRAVAFYSPVATAEVMTHPGLADGLDRSQTRLVEQRRVEFEALCSEKTKQYFKDSAIKLVHYGQL
jgi:hopanoid biosynthesis associated protein HpnK